MVLTDLLHWPCLPCILRERSQRILYRLVFDRVGQRWDQTASGEFCGDQFTSANKHLAKLVFDGFYWTINFGSFFASLLMPLLRNLGPAVAFGIPGVLMFIATILFWLGRGQYARNTERDNCCVAQQLTYINKDAKAAEIDRPVSIEPASFAVCWHWWNWSPYSPLAV